MKTKTAGIALGARGINMDQPRPGVQHSHGIHGAAIYGVPWIPSIYPSHVSINIPAPWIRHGIGQLHFPQRGGHIFDGEHLNHFFYVRLMADERKKVGSEWSMVL